MRWCDVVEDLRPVEVTMPADAPPANELVLLLVVTGHGIGHLSQCAPVIAALRRMRSLKLCVSSSTKR